MTITITKTQGNWTFGTVGSYDFEVKHFDKPSTYGIKDGKISKLWIGKKDILETITRYDRGWDMVPLLDDEIEATSAVIDRFN